MNGYAKAPPTADDVVTWVEANLNVDLDLTPAQQAIIGRLYGVDDSLAQAWPWAISDIPPGPLAEYIDAALKWELDTGRIDLDDPRPYRHMQHTDALVKARVNARLRMSR